MVNLLKFWDALPDHTKSHWRDVPFSPGEAEEWLRAGFPGGYYRVAENWRDAGFDATSAANWIQATGNLEPEIPAEWRQRFGAAVGLMKAMEWSHRTTGLMLSIEWLDLGFTPAPAFTWHMKYSFEAAEAAGWKRAGYSAQAAAAICREQGHSRPPAC